MRVIPLQSPWGPSRCCAGRNLVLQQGDATVARLSLYRVFRSVHMRRRKQELVAWCASGHSCSPNCLIRCSNHWRIDCCGKDFGVLE